MNDISAILCSKDQQLLKYIHMKLCGNEEKKYRNELSRQYQALVGGDISIFTIYDPSNKRPKTKRTEEKNQIPNILILDFEE